MIVCFVLAICVLSTLVLGFSILRALSLEHDPLDDDDVAPQLHIYDDDDEASLIAINTQQLTGELATLGELEKAGMQKRAAMSSGWLPLQRTHHAHFSKRALRPRDDAVQNYAEQRDGSVHTLDLRRHKRISHDTYYLGTNPHPHEPNVELHSYAFVHSLKPPKAASHAAAGHMLNNVERSEKYKHFNRTQRDTLETASRHHSNQRVVVECGAPIAIGARFKQSRGYYLHPINRCSMPINDVIMATEDAAETWRCVLRQLHQEVMGPLLGVLLDDDTKRDSVEFTKPTGDNHIAFANIKMADGTEDTTIAVTVTHGVYGGRVEHRYISEFSTLFNDAYCFSNCLASQSNCKRTKSMDLQNIASHELGHAHGRELYTTCSSYCCRQLTFKILVDDLYSQGTCASTTMFWSALPGETHKRTLTEQDELAMLALYSYEPPR